MSVSIAAPPLAHIRCLSLPLVRVQMNSLAALLHVCSLLSLPDAPQQIAGFEPNAFAEEVDGSSVAAQGYMPILHMRHFQVHFRPSCT